MKINGVKIENTETYRSLRQIFDGKNPSQQTVLIFKLLYEKNLSLQEAELLNDGRPKPTKDPRGGGFRVISTFESNELANNQFPKL